MAEQLTTITSKFQVHIPVVIRRAIGLKKHGVARIFTKDGQIIVDPRTGSLGLLELAGKYKVKRPIPMEKIKDFIDYTDGKR